jgi:acyl-CoA thioesterase FadM
VTYEFTWQARSSSVDETEHIYHPELFRLVDEGIEALLEEIGVPLSQLIPEEGYALPIVHAEADFTAPIRFGDEVACRIDPDPGESSVRFEASGTVDGEHVFDALVVRTFVEMETFDSESLPADLRERLGQV